jgi:hypothetical protein
MTPKEKAEELVLKYLRMKTAKMFNGWWHKQMAKQCAIIAVDEILKITWVDKFLITGDYWQEVKQEIEKL